MIFCIGYSLLSVALLSMLNYDWKISLAYSLIITIFIGIRYKIDYKIRKHHYILFAILVIAMVFRYEPYLYIMGGQDEGIYVMMSEQYTLTGSPFIEDPVRSIIKDNETQSLYDRQNHLNFKNPILGKYEGNHLPGIYIKDLENNQYVFQFYPLHPLWMALSSGIFGNDNRIYSLTLFSIISIIAFFLIAKELTGKNLPGYIIALLLAINPLHAYFSKFPVTEITALAFSSAAFYYLLRYYRSKDASSLVFSALLIGCYFFTRITGFLYVTFLYIILIITLAYLNRGEFRKNLIFYFISVFFLYFLSVMYGLIYSFPYSHDVYKIFSFLGDNYTHKIIFIIIALTLIPFFISKLKNFASRLKRYKSMMFYILLAVIFVSLNRTILLGFNNGTFQLADTFRSNLFVIGMYLGPFIFMAIFPAAYYFIKKDERYNSIIIFLILFSFFKLIHRWTTNYNYYYARYTLTELVPFFMLIAVIWLFHIYSKKNVILKAIIITMLMFTSIYFVYFSSFQFQGPVADGANEALKQVKQEIGKNDLLIFEKNGFYLQGYIYPSLKYYYDINTFLVSTSYNLLKPKYRGFLNEYDDIYIISQRKEKCYGNNLELIKEIDYKMGMYKHSNLIPTKFEYPNTQLYLYRIKDLEMIFQSSKNICLSQVSKRGFYGNTWTNGSAIITNLDIETNQSDQYLYIKTNGWNPHRNNIEKLDLNVSIDGEELILHNWTKTEYYFNLPQTNKVNNITISTNTFIPKEEGINNDTTPLGLDIIQISFKGTNNLE